MQYYNVRTLKKHNFDSIVTIKYCIILCNLYPYIFVILAEYELNTMFQLRWSKNAASHFKSKQFPPVYKGSHKCVSAFSFEKELWIFFKQFLSKDVCLVNKKSIIRARNQGKQILLNLQQSYSTEKTV